MKWPVDDWNSGCSKLKSLISEYHCLTAIFAADRSSLAIFQARFSPQPFLWSEVECSNFALFAHFCAEIEISSTKLIGGVSICLARSLLCSFIAASCAWNDYKIDNYIVTWLVERVRVDKKYLVPCFVTSVTGLSVVPSTAWLASSCLRFATQAIIVKYSVKSTDPLPSVSNSFIMSGNASL